ncbi:cupredoxin domain-containing protein [Thermus scotoductus]|uniref:Cytochrome C oxidase subunit II n=2 Tax=Thermus scotoductus TaxID=37636 RepID=A0A430UTK7_THESC|nr:cupredoxin domain-containing protein [Thermus scotoductus]RTI12014.1 cytochrome C oxidase subunit II [Thermus scotoductus]RTI12183.1 cytochrome C oxidase subunit II [Thermus scotoductus]
MEKRSHSPVSLLRLGVLVLGAVILVVAAALLVRPYIPSAVSPQGTVLRISMSGWQPNVVQAKAGKPVTLTVVNLDNSFHTDGGGWHNFVLVGQDLEVRIPPKRTSTFTFLLNRPGEYLFYCDLCCGGKDNPFMRGKVVVSS